METPTQTCADPAAILKNFTFLEFEILPWQNLTKFFSFIISDWIVELVEGLPTPWYHWTLKLYNLRLPKVCCAIFFLQSILSKNVCNSDRYFPKPIQQEKIHS